MKFFIIFCNQIMLFESTEHLLDSFLDNGINIPTSTVTHTA
jgi:hypothetical protein